MSDEVAHSAEPVHRGDSARHPTYAADAIRNPFASRPAETAAEPAQDEDRR